MTERALVKRALVTLLDEVAEEHHSGHQPGKAARYVLTTGDGTRLEIMLQKDEKSPPNLWVLEKAGKPLLSQQMIPAKLSPKSKLWVAPGKNGPTYGRHTGLLPMNQLNDQNLLCLAPESLEQVGAILDHLLSITAADLK